jgi:hypothetical protein
MQKKTPPRRTVRALPVAAATLAVLPAGASAATKPRPAKLVVTSVSAPPSKLQAGDRFTVTGKVTNTGGTSSPANVALELRAGSSPKVVSPLGSDSIAKVRPGSTRTFRARVTVGRTVRVKGRDSTSYLLAACVRPKRGSVVVSCRKASGRTSVAAPPAQVVPAPATPAPTTPVPTAPTPTTPTTPAPEPTTPTTPTTPDPTTVFTPGTRSLGDTLFPTIGNGGYDAQHYDLDLDYTISSKLLKGTTTVTAVATQDLSEYSFDLTAWNGVTAVTVDGKPATFAVDYEKAKLIVTPPTGIPEGTTFTTAVTYGGIQKAYIDPDGSQEGFVPSTTYGAIVVSEPVGAMGFFPNNNVPFDKATFTTRMTVPYGWSVVGSGVLKTKTDTGTAATDKSTFVWDETNPTATYLYQVAIGKYDLSSPDPAAPAMTSPLAGPLTPTLTNPSVPYYTAIDSSFTNKASILGRLNGTTTGFGQNGGSGALDYFADYYGVPYPFTAQGGIVPRQNVQYSLETQGKPTYATSTSATNAGPSVSTVAHENGHMYFGDAVTLTHWKDIWLNEGMTEFSTWLYSANVTTPPITLDTRFATYYTAQNGTTYWSVPPANPPTAVDIFDTSAMYNRGATTMLQVRAVLGEATFRAMMKRWITEHLYSNVTTEQFIALVKETDPTRAARWTEFFRQWLYTSYTTAGQKPTMTKDNFDTFVLP